MDICIIQVPREAANETLPTKPIPRVFLKVSVFPLGDTIVVPGGNMSIGGGRAATRPPRRIKHSGYIIKRELVIKFRKN